MQTIQLGDVIGRSKDSVWCDVNGDVAVLHVASGVYFGVEGAGVAIWKLIEQPGTVLQVVDHLMNSFNISRQECEQQTLAFLQELLDKELILIHSDVRVA